MVASTKRETCVIFLTMIVAAAVFWMPAQTKTNMWSTLASMTDQDSICLAMASPENPFHACLVGIPLDDYSSITQLFQNRGWCRGIATNCNNTNMAPWINCLLEIDIEPQELELLASMPMDTCINLVCEKCQSNIREHEWINCKILMLPLVTIEMKLIGAVPRRRIQGMSLIMWEQRPQKPFVWCILDLWR